MDMEATLTANPPPAEFPALNPAQRKRLRQLFAFGRPVSLSELKGSELDLLALGLLRTVPASLSACAVVEVTELGVALLAHLRSERSQALQHHSTLGGRLAQHLRTKGMLTWEDIAMYNPNRTYPRPWSMVRPDVYACAGAMRADLAQTAIYEVKVSKADFRAEMAKPEKLAAYQDLAESVYFCCPAGLIEPADIPDGVGLLHEVEHGVFALVRKARRRKDFQPHPDVLMTLMVKRQDLRQSEVE